MPDIIIRNVDSSVIDGLTVRAQYHNLSLEDEIKLIFDTAAHQTEPMSKLECARRLRASIKNKNQTDSAILLCEDRQR